MKVKAISVFRDKFTNKLYKVGDTIEIGDKDRVADLVKRGLIESIEEIGGTLGIPVFNSSFDKKTIVDALKSINVQVAMNMKDDTILSKVAELDDEKMSELKKILEIE